jgi:hypothetical protein
MTQWTAFAISLVSEALTAALLAFALWRQARLAGLAALSAIVGTSLTHPIVWPLALYLYSKIGYWPGFVAVEAFAILSEWLVYRLLTRASWFWSLVLSLVANGVSLSLGLIL